MDNAEKKTQKEQGISFKEIWYAIKKNWIVEVAVFVVILIVGIIATGVNKDYYVARNTVVVKASMNDSQSINNTTLSKQQVVTVADLIKNNSQIRKAAGNPSGSLSVSYSEDSLIMSLTFTSVSKEEAKNGLDAIIKASKEFIEETENKVSDVSKEIKVAKKGDRVDISDADDRENVEVYKGDKKLEKGIEYNVDGGDITDLDVGSYTLKYTSTTIVSKWFSATVGINAADVTSVSAQSNDRRIILLSLLGGVVAAFVVAILLYLINDKVSSVERVESVSGVKNIATIEKIKDAENVDGYLQLDVKKISDTLIYMNAGDGNKVYQVQSAISGEGKSTITVNVATTLVASQRKVLIIDCDFSRPSIHRMFKVSKKTGIVDYFKGNVDFDGIIKHTSEGVDLITCGDVVTNHTVFFASKKFADIVEEAKGRYDFVFLDGAPIKALSDYIHLAKVCEGTILVVGNDKIKTRDLSFAVSELESCNANLVGTVFNFSNKETRKRYYYYYYYNKRRDEKK